MTKFAHGAEVLVVEQHHIRPDIVIRVLKKVTA
jgi:hypothetical protein